MALNGSRVRFTNCVTSTTSTHTPSRDICAPLTGICFTYHVDTAADGLSPFPVCSVGVSHGTDSHRGSGSIRHRHYTLLYCLQSSGRANPPPNFRPSIQPAPSKLHPIHSLLSLPYPLLSLPFLLPLSFPLSRLWGKRFKFPCGVWNGAPAKIWCTLNVNQMGYFSY